MNIIDGKAFSERVREKVKSHVDNLKTNHDIVPGLAVVLVGEDPASKVYVKNKGIQTKEAGMNSYEYKLEETVDEKNTRIVLSLKPHLSPIKAAVIPLKRNNEELVNNAKEIKNNLQRLGLGRVILENSGNIGKSYRRHDEIGTPICITVDFETLENKSVTIRDRDTMEQKRLNPQELNEFYEKIFD